jgi:enoyl-CoA hydratase
VQQVAKVLYERDGRIARITLNRPGVLNAIDDELPVELAGFFVNVFGRPD